MSDETIRPSSEATAPQISDTFDPIGAMLRARILDPPDRPGIVGRLERFDVLELIGSGGMGVILLVQERGTSRQYALKTLKPVLARDPYSVRLFLREGRHMQQMDHPSILRVLEVSDRLDGPYFITSFVQRGSLAQLLRQGEPLDYQVALNVALQVADALAYAHERGVIHRDLKPANVLVDGEGHAYVADFGMVRDLYGDSTVGGQQAQAVGTGPYMSPGVAAGQAEDTRCDIYSFGALLYEMLTGQPPYDGATTQEVIEKILSGPPPVIRQVNPSAPPALIAVAEGAMARELRDRYASMVDVAEDLRKIQAGQPPRGPRGEGRSRRAPLAAGALVFAFLVVVGIVMLLRHDATNEAQISPAMPTASGLQQAATVASRGGNLAGQAATAPPLATTSGSGSNTVGDYQPPITPQGVSRAEPRTVGASIPAVPGSAVEAEQKRQTQVLAEQLKSGLHADDYDKVGALLSLGPSTKASVLDALRQSLEPQTLRNATSAAERGNANAQLLLGVMYHNGQGVVQDRSAGAKWWRKAAEQGLAEAQYKLGCVFSTGQGAAQDKAEAAKWYRSAADQGHAHAQVNLGNMYAHGDGVEKDGSEAVKWWRKAAEQGDFAGQTDLGGLLANGDGVKQDRAEAAEWYRKAAEQGFAPAQYRLGAAFSAGEGVVQDKEEAIKWWRRAADQGDAQAQISIGVAYFRGDGVVEDKVEAIRWWRKAAEQSDPDAQYKLGIMYDTGQGVAQDKAEAARWFREAGEKGYAQAQYNLGNMYAKGEGVVQDKVGAVVWYRMAADQGLVQAQYSLGVAYSKGEGVVQDKAEAARWYRKAADQGEAHAQVNLGSMYANGQGVMQDKAEAAELYRKAAEQGDALGQLNLAGMYANGEGVLRSSSSAVEWYARAGKALLAEGNAKLARTCYVRMQSIDPNAPQTRELGTLLSAPGGAE